MLAAFPPARGRVDCGAGVNNQNEFYRGVEAAGRALARCTDADDAAAAVHAAIAGLAAAPNDAVAACAAGCAHCCHFPVGITWPEGRALVQALRHDPVRQQAVLAAADATAAASWQQLVGVPCPLLVDGRCAVYTARPLPCRSLISADATACRLSLAGEPVSVPRDEAAFWRGLGASHALAEASGIPPRELRSALAALLRAPDDRSTFAAARPAG